MHLKPYISPECVVTMADGSYKSVSELTEGDEVQTYNMDDKSFDSANIHANEQTSTNITRISNIEISRTDIVKVTLSPEKLWVDGEHENEPGVWEETGDSKTIKLYNQVAVMGGANSGWLVANQDKVIKTSITDETADDLKAKFGQLETGAQIQLDRGDDLKMRDVESIETMSEDGVETFRLIILEDGDSVFVDDVMLAVTRQRGENIPPEEDK